MCYSTMIEANFKQLSIQFDAELDWDSIESAYKLRSSYSAARIPAAIDTYIMQNAETAREKRLAQLAKNYYADELAKLNAKKEKYENDCIAFEEKIKKGSKAKDLDKKLKKRRKSVLDLKRQIAHYSQIEESGAARVFPNFYAPNIVLSDDGRRKIHLMRYHILPASGKELVPFKYNLFNARKDRIISSRVWKPLFGKQHALMPFYRFYESVDDGKGGSQGIYFQSRENEMMWSAALFELCDLASGRLESQAAITDEPPEEVKATGHDRCPIFLSSDQIDNWLSPSMHSKDFLFELLDRRTPTYFENVLVA